MIERMAILCTLAALGGCTTMNGAPQALRATAEVRSTTGQTLGTIELREAPGGYRLTGTVTGISPGVHGIHLHTSGACDAPDFKSAGGHLNPTGQGHGSLNPDGKHLGDLPNLTADADGAAQISADLSDDRAFLDRALFDQDGTAIVIHAGADDNRSNPSGNSGARIACGVLERN